MGERPEWRGHGGVLEAGKGDVFQLRPVRPAQRPARRVLRRRATGGLQAQPLLPPLLRPPQGRAVGGRLHHAETGVHRSAPACSTACPRGRASSSAAAPTSTATSRAATSELTESQADNGGRTKTPTRLPRTGASRRMPRVTRSARCLSGCPSGFSGGGLDDRFDIWLTRTRCPTARVSTGCPAPTRPMATTASTTARHQRRRLQPRGAARGGQRAARRVDHLPTVIEIRCPPRWRRRRRWRSAA